MDASAEQPLARHPQSPLVIPSVFNWSLSRDASIRINLHHPSSNPPAIYCRHQLQPTSLIRYHIDFHPSQELLFYFFTSTSKHPSQHTQIAIDISAFRNSKPSQRLLGSLKVHILARRARYTTLSPQSRLIEDLPFTHLRLFSYFSFLGNFPGLDTLLRFTGRSFGILPLSVQGVTLGLYPLLSWIGVDIRNGLAAPSRRHTGGISRFSDFVWALLLFLLLEDRAEPASCIISYLGMEFRRAASDSLSAETRVSKGVCMYVCARKVE